MTRKHSALLNAEIERVTKSCCLRNADQCFEAKVKCPTGRGSFWVKLLTVGSKTPSLSRGGGGGVVGFEIDWYIYSVIGTKQALNDNSQALNEKTDKSETRCIKSSQNHIIIT